MILVWGHRGCRGTGNPPENSMSAFKSALKQGADGVELDVFLTKDRQLVIFHDDTLERMTEGRGNITSFTFAELNKLRLKDNNGKLTSEKIPLLDELLDFIEQEASDHFTVNIEIKGLGIAEYVVKCVKSRLKNGWRRDRLVLSSFDMKSLEEAREHDRDVVIGALLESRKEPWNVSKRQLESFLPRIKNLKPDTVNITLSSMTEKTVDMIRKSGAEAVAWTSREKDPASLSSAQRATIRKKLKGVHAIITDYPAQMRQLLQQ